MSWVIHGILLHNDYTIIAAKMQELYKYAAKSSKKKSDISTQTAIEVI